MTDNTHNPLTTPVAIVGMTAIYPGEPGLGGFWRTITAGRDAISDVPPSHWLIEDYYDPDPKATDRTYCKRGGFIDPVPFDPVRFGLPPNALPSTDSAQLLALIAARKVLDEAMRSGVEIDLDRVDVVLGVASTTELVVQMGSRMQRPIWRKAMLENGLPEDEADQICRDIADHYPVWQEATVPGLLGNVVAGRTANRLDLGGSNFVVDAACASSLSALQTALHRLYLHEADLVLTGGVDALNDVMMYMCFSKTPAFSPTGDCRPFSAGADGTIIGEGVGMLALKRLNDAERDGDRIHAVIRGLGSSSDGRASSVYAPRAEGQAKALRRAYERVGYEPSTVELVEAHGTATKAGDVAEFAGLKSVFTGDGARIALGSVKSQIGHTKAAAGAAGLIKAALALQHSTLPATLKVDRPNPALGLQDTPFYVNTQTRPWVRPGGQPRRAAVSSFGFGGSNFHVTLEEYRGEHRAKRLRALPTELVVLSAASEADLVQRTADISTAIRTGESLARIAFDAARAFDASEPARAGLVAADVTALEALVEKLRSALADGTAARINDPNIAVGFGPAREGKTAFLFPGQGSQYVGMGADLALAFPEAVAVWDGLDGDLADLHRVVFPEPAFDAASSDAQRATLTAMENAQPAIAATSLAQLALLHVLGVAADAAAGHSFGELTALAAAGVLPTERLAETARTRGVLMAAAGRGQDGTMLAITASADDVRQLLQTQPESAGSLVIANDNAPGQVVLAGRETDIAWAQSAAKSAGWTSVRLPVASAFHSPIVAAAAEPFTAYLETLKMGGASFPVYANATAQPYGDRVADQLGDQLRQPVRFREMIAAMARDGVTRFIEVGPGRVLTKLVDQILETTAHIAVALDDPKGQGLRAWHRGLAALAVDGVALDLAALYGSYDEPEAHMPAPKHAVMVGGANVGKPYPPVGGTATAAPRRTRANTAPPPPVDEIPSFTAVSAPNGSTAARVHSLPGPDAVRAHDGAVPAGVATLSEPTPASPHEPIPASPPNGASSRAAQTPLSRSADAWSIIDRIQQETAQQHERYLDVMTRSHQSFLDMSARMLAEIVGDHAQDYDSSANATALPATAAKGFALHAGSEMVAAAMPTAAAVPAIAATPGVIATPAIRPAPQPEPSVVVEHRPAASAPPAASSAGSPSVSAGEVVLAIVSEKTGYPVDMLGLGMEMESELGIDSIKQVEILAALQGRFPGAPEVAASELAGLRTLQDVVDSVAGFASGGAVEQPAQEPLPASSESSSAGLCCTEITFRAVPPSGLAMAGLRDGEVLITREDPAFADALERTMISHGIKARAVDEVPHDAGAVISLAALATVASTRQCIQMHQRAFHAARSVARSNERSRLFVTVQATGGRFAPTHTPVGVAGIVKTASWEWPNASVRAVDMEILDAERLTIELLEGGVGVEVALRDDGARLLVDDVEASPPGDAIELPGGGVVVVTGGARGVTAQSALALAARHGLRLALLGRTRLPAAASAEPAGSTVTEVATALVASARIRGESIRLPPARAQAESLMSEREVRHTLSAAEAQGTAARYFTADINDSAELHRVLDEVRQHLGPIVGVVHGAGVLADKRLEDLDDDQFDTVFSTKVAGAEALLDATSCDELRFISLFSSIAARAGNPGQSAYAAANAALEAIAAREAAHRGDACAVRAFGWGPWDGGMVDATLKSRFLEAGVGVIPIKAGTEFFADRALRRSTATAIVVAAPATPRLRATRLDWEVSTESLPPLADHQLQGRVVIPVVIVLDAILRAARGLIPDASPAVCDFQVLSGVTFAECEQQALTIDFEPTGASYTVTVSDRAGRRRYRALLEAQPASRPGLAVAEVVGPLWPTSVEEAYAGPLFHGPRFAAIERLGVLGAAGGTADVKGRSTLGWPEWNWAIDPLSVDGGLQLGILWAAADGRPLMLPVRIARAVFHRNDAGALRCRLAARPISDKQVDFDIVFETSDGELVAELAGVEFYVVGPGDRSA